MKIKNKKGFTFIEIIIVMLLLALLASLAAPVVSTSLTKGREAVLKENLSVTRKALDDYFADHGLYPDDLEALVNQQYLRTLPFDPILKSSAEWTTIDSDDEEISGIKDIRSASLQQANDGSYYSEW